MAKRTANGGASKTRANGGSRKRTTKSTYPAVEIGEEVVIRLRLAPAPSGSGKMILIGQTGGWQVVEGEYDGKPIKVNAMVGIAAN